MLFPFLCQFNIDPSPNVASTRTQALNCLETYPYNQRLPQSVRAQLAAWVIENSRRLLDRNADVATFRATKQNTRKSHESAWVKWKHFCQFSGIASPFLLPVALTHAESFSQEQTMRGFVAYAYDSGLLTSSIRTYVASINAIHSDQLGAPPAWSIPVLTQLNKTFKGFERLQAVHKSARRHFLPPEALREMCTYLSGNFGPPSSEAAISALTLRAALATGFEGLLRGCEYTTAGDGSWLSRTNLSCADFHYNEPSHGGRASWIHVKEAKNDQFGNNAGDRVYLHRAAEYIQAMLEAYPPPQGVDPALVPLFRTGTRAHSPLKQDTLRQRMKALLKSAFIKRSVLASKKGFGLHAIRAGAATALHAAGMPDNSIQRMGRWRSDCYQEYLRDHFHEAQRCLKQMFAVSTAGHDNTHGSWLDQSENDAVAFAVLWDERP